MNKKLLPFLILILFLFIFSCSKDDENIPPTCTIDVIQNNMEVLKGIPIYFPVDAEDEDGNIVSVWITIDEVGHDTATAPPYEFSWETLNQSSGSHNITANARNEDGEVATHSIQVKVVTSGDPVVPCPEAISISYAGQTYNTVKIGDQCWIKENMNVTTENSVYYNDYPDNGETFGQLYNWEEAMTVCPPGWRLPSNDDWCTLVQHVDASAGCQLNEQVGTDAGFKLKSTGSGWMNNQSGSDQFGFKALPGGFKLSNGNYSELGHNASFWTSSEDSDDLVSNWHINDVTTKIVNSKVLKSHFLSVRCVKE